MIPVATTTIRVLRSQATENTDPTEDPGDDHGNALEPVVVASGVRAQISTSRGEESPAGGQQEVVAFRLSCDPVDLQHLDQVEDEATGELYEVTWARQRQGLGLDHTQAGLRQVRGVVSVPRLALGQ